MQLFKNLGSATLRIGGGTVDGSLWSPSSSSINQCATAQTVIDPTLLNDIFGFAGTIGWKITWQVPLKHSNASLYSAEAAAAINTGLMDNSLLSIEFGNEPEYYGISMSQYRTNWMTYYSALKSMEPSISLPQYLSGPATEHLPWLQDFASHENSNVSFDSVHYFNQKCGDVPPYPTITNLLSPTTLSKTVSFLSTALADAQGIPLSINATNSYCHGGRQGVSDVFASALWATDYAFTAAQQRVRRLNFLGVPNNPSGNSSGEQYYYAPINMDGTPAPIYYGLLLYHYATQAGGSMVSTTPPSPSANVTAYSVLGADGHLRLTIINKDQALSATVNINTTRSYSSATALSLLAPSINATSGITLGGAAIASDGTWTPTTPTSVPVSGANSSITVPAGSAVVITYM